MAGTAIGALPAADRVRLGAAGLRTFFRVADEWGLTVADQSALLGDIGRSTHHAWRRHPPRTAESYTTDRLTRLSYVLGIYGTVQRLYGESPPFARAWMTAPNADLAFHGRAPLAIMRDLGIPGMHLVRRVLEAQAGGSLEGGDVMRWDAVFEPAEIIATQH